MTVIKRRKLFIEYNHVYHIHYNHTNEENKTKKKKKNKEKKKPSSVRFYVNTHIVHKHMVNNNRQTHSTAHTIDNFYIIEVYLSTHILFNFFPVISHSHSHYTRKKPPFHSTFSNISTHVYKIQFHTRIKRQTERKTENKRMKTTTINRYLNIDTDTFMYG